MTSFSDVTCYCNIAAEKAKNREIINNLNNKRNSSSLLSTSMSTSTPASQVKKVKKRNYREMVE